MSRIRVNANDGSLKPAFTPPDPGIEENLHLVADLDLFSHIASFAAVSPQDEPNANDDHHSAVDGPLRITCHVAARQHIYSLKKKRAAGKDEQDADDVQNRFHFIYIQTVTEHIPGNHSRFQRKHFFVLTLAFPA
jgi:hypothetical protein